MDKEMEVLLSEKELTFGDKTVVVKRIALLDTIRLASQISEIVSQVLSNDKIFGNAMGKLLYSGRPEKDKDGNDIAYDGEETADEISSIRIMGAVELIGLIGDDGIELLKSLMQKSTNLTAQELENIDCVDGIDIIAEIYEVNKSFFGKCMSKLKEKMPKKKKGEKKTK